MNKFFSASKLAIRAEVNALVASFLLTGGTVTVLRSGQSNGMTLQDWKDRVSDRGIAQRVAEVQATA
jgi:hypothetical protein